ncbi:MAG: hypothetical protein V1644_00040 [Candidatus Micrarchaeota archaeon]
MKCIFCGKRTKYREIVVTLQGGVPSKAWQCVTCKDYYLDPEATQKVLLLNKLQRGVSVKMGKLGNSIFFRFPADVVRLFNLKKGKEATARVVSNKGKLVFEISPN